MHTYIYLFFRGTSNYEKEGEANDEPDSFDDNSYDDVRCFFDDEEWSELAPCERKRYKALKEKHELLVSMSKINMNN